MMFWRAGVHRRPLVQLVQLVNSAMSATAGALARRSRYHGHATKYPTKATATMTGGSQLYFRFTQASPLLHARTTKFCGVGGLGAVVPGVPKWPKRPQ